MRPPSVPSRSASVDLPQPRLESWLRGSDAHSGQLAVPALRGDPVHDLEVASEVVGAEELLLHAAASLQAHLLPALIVGEEARDRRADLLEVARVRKQDTRA